MRVDRRWLWIAGAVAAGIILIAAGVSLSTLLIVVALLACPVSMALGRRGMSPGDAGLACHPGPPKADSAPAATSAAPVARK